jgi:copper chaperone CopZ
MTMVDTITFSVGGMTCEGCSGRVRDGLLSVNGVLSAEVSHETGTAVVQHDNISKDLLSGAVKAIGYTVDGEGDEFHWKDGGVWRQSASNTKWCLIGCSIGEFGTLGYYEWAGWPLEVSMGTTLFIFLAILPIINGLITSVALETSLLMRGQMDFNNALKTALGMSFIGMIAMELAMEATDWLLTGNIGMTWWVIPPMLIAGFLTPWPYNYWRLKKYGMACH